MRERKTSFDEAGLTIVPVGQGTPSELKRFLSSRDYPFTLYTDPERISYRAYGVERGGWREIAISPKVIADGARAAAGGHLTTKVVGDVKQLPGSFVVVDGQVVYAHRGKVSSDVGDIEELLAAV